MNLTDIDDKIINRANERNTSCTELAEKFIEELEDSEDVADYYTNVIL